MSVIDPQAATQLCQDIERRLMEMPIEQLRQEHRKMAIEAHNAEVDRKKQNRLARALLGRLR